MAAAAAPKPSRGARTGAPRRPLRPVAAPRRVSGPSRGRAGAAAGAGVGTRTPRQALLGTLERFLRHPLLERLVRGRWSIGLIAFALIGIVTLQLGLLQLNARLGRSLVRLRSLERQNASLSIENSGLAAGERVQELAKRLGMAPTSLGAIRFLRASYGRGVSAKAAAALQASVVSSEGGSASTGASAQAGAASSNGEAGAPSSTGEASSEASTGEAGSEASSGEASTSGSSAQAGASSSGGEASGEASSGVASTSGESAGGGATAEAGTGGEGAGG